MEHENETRALEAMRRELADVTTQRDRAIERAKAAEDALLVRDVDALIGVSITPAQRDNALALARRDRSLFEAFVGSQPRMHHLSRIVGPEDRIAPPPVHSTGTSDELAELMNDRSL